MSFDLAPAAGQRHTAEFMANTGRKAPRVAKPLQRKEPPMAKSQKKSSKEIRKPKAEKPPKQNASNPSQKDGVVKGLDNMKR
jgi:hypothetical protein